MKKAIFGTIVFIVPATASLKAQTTELSIKDTVVIHENRLQSVYSRQNRNIQVIDKAEIQKLAVKSINEILAYAAGVDMRQRGPSGSQADVAIDGSTFDQVLVLINGMKVSDPQTGHNMMNLPVPISAIDHIEILRGPAARTYGVNALAGAINIVTRIADHNEVSAQVYSGSSFKKDDSTGETYYNVGAQAAATLAAKNQTHSFSIGHDQGNGYRYNTAYDATRLFYQNHISISKKSSIDAMGGYVRNEFGANAFYAAPYDNEAKETAETALGSIGYTLQLNDKVKIMPRISYRYGKDDYIFIRQDPSVYRNIHETNVVTGEVQSTIRLGAGVLGAGVEMRNEGINSTNLGKRDRSNLGVYAEYKYSFNSKLNVSAGLYANNNSDYGTQFFPGVDVGYFFLPKWKVFAAATTGQRLPTYTDLYYKGPTNIGNDQLKPEESNYSEVGVQFKQEVLFGQVSVFNRHTTNFIDWVRDNESAPWQPQNFQTLNTMGITLQAKYALSKHFNWSKNYQLQANTSYTYLDQTIETTPGKVSKYAIEALRHQWIVGLQGLFYGKLQANVNARYQQRISANDYTLLDARISYQYKSFNLYADLNNIFDTQYKEVGAVPMPGRWFTLGLRFQGNF